MDHRANGVQQTWTRDNRPAPEWKCQQEELRWGRYFAGTVHLPIVPFVMEVLGPYLLSLL